MAQDSAEGVKSCAERTSARRWLLATRHSFLAEFESSLLRPPEQLAITPEVVHAQRTVRCNLTHLRSSGGMEQLGREHPGCDREVRPDDGCGLNHDGAGGLSDPKLTPTRDLRHTVERPGALQECEPHARAHEPRFEECVTPRSAVEDRGLAEQVKATPDVPYKPFVENQRLVVLFTRAAGTVDSVAALDS